MKKLLELRAEAFNKAEVIAKLVKDENRSMTTEEMESMQAAQREVEELDAKIAIQKKQDELRAANAKPVTTHLPAQGKEERKAVERYSLLTAIRSAVNPAVALTGIEKEMHDEAIREQRDARVDGLITGGVNVPSILMRANEQVVDPAAQGGYTVDTSIAEVVSILRPETAVREAGATFLTGLRGDVAFPPQDTGAVATWKGEIESADQGAQTYSTAKLTPHRLPVYTPISLQLLAQSSIDMEQFVRRDLEGAIGQALEEAIFNGSGVGSVPLGVLNTVGLPIHPLGTDGGAMTFDDLVALETLVAANNADKGRMGYITNSKVRGSLKTERKDTGSGIMTWGTAVGDNILNGRSAYVSNNMPDDLTKGAGTDLSAMIYGNWNDCLVGNWAGMNMIVDPYTKAIEGQVVLVANTFWDILLRRIKSFSAAVDIITA